MKKVKVICMALLAVIAMASCRGPRGPEGPEGPAGPAGQDGNANVVSSTVTVYPNDWYFDNNTSWRVDIEYKAIDADIHDYGAVLVYMNQENTWRQLPFTFYYSQNLQDGSVGYFSSSLEVSTYEEGVSIFWTENDFYDGYRPEQHDFKIVVIAASLYEARSDVDYSDYEAVKRAFQLEEK